MEGVKFNKWKKKFILKNSCEMIYGITCMQAPRYTCIFVSQLFRLWLPDNIGPHKDSKSDLGLYMGNWFRSSVMLDTMYVTLLWNHPDTKRAQCFSHEYLVTNLNVFSYLFSYFYTGSILLHCPDIWYMIQ